jgi:hypothetical protein
MWGLMFTVVFGMQILDSDDIMYIFSGNMKLWENFWINPTWSTRIYRVSDQIM